MDRPEIESKMAPSGYSKHKSLGDILPKKEILEELSPLMRVEELLKNMKNMQSQRSKSKEQKKMVNVKIPKQFN